MVGSKLDKSFWFNRKQCMALPLGKTGALDSREFDKLFPNSIDLMCGTRLADGFHLVKSN